MDKSIVFYSTGCPKCRILKKKLDEKGIQYEICSDEEQMIGLGLEEVPALGIKGRIYSFREAVEWLNHNEGAPDEHQH